MNDWEFATNNICFHLSGNEWFLFLIGIIRASVKLVFFFLASCLLNICARELVYIVYGKRLRYINSQNENFVLLFVEMSIFLLSFHFFSICQIDVIPLYLSKFVLLLILLSIDFSYRKNRRIESGSETENLQFDWMY